MNSWRTQWRTFRSFLQWPGTRAQVRRFQSERVRRLISHAYEQVPFYRRLFDGVGLDPRDVRTVSDLRRIPIIAKEDVRNADPGDLIARNVDRRHLVADRTSGTSGDPSTVWRTALERTMTVLFWLRAFRSHGLRVTDRRASVTYSSAARPRRRGAFSKALARLGLYRHRIVNCGEPVADIIRSLVAYRPDFLTGYTASVWHVAQELCGSLSGDVRPRAVSIGAETLTEAMRRTIREAFAAPVYEIYASHEFNVIAWECLDTGEMHTCDDALVVEVLRDGRPARPGEKGELVATNLHSFAAPFIRYRLSDIVTQGSPVCSCGLPFSTLKGIEGRLVEHLVLPDGRWMHPAELVRPVLAGASWIRRMQIVQERDDRVVLLLAPLVEPPPGAVSAIDSAFRGMLGPDIETEIAVVRQIQPGPGGKYRLILPLKANPRA